MNKINDILEEIKDLDYRKEELKKKIKEYVKDKSIPLEDRWDMFIKSRLGGEDCYIIHWKSLPDRVVGYAGPIYAERHQNVEVTYILETIEEHKQMKEEDVNEDEDYDEDLADVDIDKFKEEVLEKFIKSYEFDW